MVYFVNCSYLEKEHSKRDVTIPDLPAEEITIDPPQRSSTKRALEQEPHDIINLDTKSEPESTPLEKSETKKAKLDEHTSEFSEQELAAAILMLRKQKSE